MNLQRGLPTSKEKEKSAESEKRKKKTGEKKERKKEQSKREKSERGGKRCEVVVLLSVCLARIESSTVG